MAALLVVFGVVSVIVYAASVNVGWVSSRIGRMSNDEQTTRLPTKRTNLAISASGGSASAGVRAGLARILSPSDGFEVIAECADGRQAVDELPAARPDVIHEGNVERLRARMVVHGANIPVTTEAEKRLAARGILSVPDFIANAGGVTVSYFEWVQDRMGYFWREDVVNERLQDKMVASFNELCHYADKHAVDTCTAAYMLAIDRVAYDTRMRGIYA